MKKEMEQKPQKKKNPMDEWGSTQQNQEERESLPVISEDMQESHEWLWEATSQESKE